MKKRIPSIIMLVVLIVGIALAAYGVTGQGIYSNAATMMGVTQKEAMGFIQDPTTLTSIGDVNSIGADSVKTFLKGLGLDAAAVDTAVDARAAFETAVANAKNRDQFFAYAQSVDATVTADNFNDLIKDRERSEPMRVEMALAELGIDEAAYNELTANTALIALYQEGVPALLQNKHMTNAVVTMFVGIILIVASGAFFLIKAMSIKPRVRTRAANPKVEKITSFLLNYADRKSVV